MQIDKLDKVRTTLLADKAKESERLGLKCIYVYGATGTGKTSGILRRHSYSNVYRVTDYQHPFDGYACQSVICFDEFRSSLKLGDMLNFCDICPIELPARHSNKYVYYTVTYIVGNWSLESQYSEIQNNREEDAQNSWKAFLRRIHEVHVYESRDKVTIYPSVEEYMNQCFEYASDEDIAIVSENVWQKAKKKINKDLIVSESVPSDEEQVFSDIERKKIKEMVYEDLKKYPKSSSAGLQILFLFETGLRIGECCGLKFSDIKDGRLYIRRQADNQGVREWTKSKAGYRDIPLTAEAQRILEDIKQFNAEHGYTAEWIFQNDNPGNDYRLGYNAADKKLRKLCARLGTTIKSPHKCRKTCISTLLDNPNVNDRTVQRFAGHTDIATTYRFYNFERKSKEEQARAIDEALSLY